MYRKISNIRRTKSPNLNVSRLVVQLSSPNQGWGEYQIYEYL